MTYNLILVAIVVIAVSIATAVSKNGPKWKAPLISLVIFLIAILLLNLLGLGNPGGD